MNRRILVAVDGSEMSNRALVAALQLARDGGGQVLLLHCVDELLLVANRGAPPQSGSQVLEESKAVAESAGVSVETRLVDMPAQRLGETVAHHAKDWRADLIVIGSHGRRGIGRLLLSSGADQVLRLAPVSVFCVRREVSAP